MPPSLVPLDVLLPTADGGERLAAVLAGLRAQSTRGFRVVVCDTGPPPGAAGPRGTSSWELPGVRQAVADLRHDGVRVELNIGRRPGGRAEQLAFLLDRTRARQVLLLGDDVVLDRQALAVLSRSLDQLRCGMVGMVPVRPGQRPSPASPPPRRWVRGVLRESLDPGAAEWQERRRVVPPRAPDDDPTWWPYRAGPLRGCALFRRRSLLAVGGFQAAVDPVDPAVLEDPPDRLEGPDDGATDPQLRAQLRIMARDGAAAIAPTAATRVVVPTAPLPPPEPISACSGRSGVPPEA